MDTDHETINHAALRWLIARIRTSKPETVASILFDEFDEALTSHLALVDRELLPLLGALPVRERQEYVDVHWYIKRSLAELRAANRFGDAFQHRLSAMCDRLERQMMREATELLPIVHDRFTPAQRVSAA